MSRLREIAAVVLVATLSFAFPAFGAATPASDALGTVVASNGASISGMGADVGTTVFPGDKLMTTDSGSVLLRAGAARFQLAKSSAATIGEIDGVPAATLLGGSAVFSTASARAFAVSAYTAVIRPRTDTPTIGQVSMLRERELLVSCTKGELTITVGDDSRVIPEGMAYRVVLDPAISEEAQTQPPPQGSGTKGPNRPPLMAAKSKFVLYATIATAIVTAYVISEVCESPDKP